MYAVLLKWYSKGIRRGFIKQIMMGLSRYIMFLLQGIKYFVDNHKGGIFCIKYIELALFLTGST